jgi:hypothetical protein
MSLILPDHVAAERAAQAPELPPMADMMIAKPFSDIQMVSLIATGLLAANRGLETAAAVDRAREVLAESIVQMQHDGGLAKYGHKIQSRLAKEHARTNTQ